MEMGVARLEHREGRRVAEALAADAVEPVSQGTHVVAGDVFDPQIFPAVALDVVAQARLPLEMGVDRFLAVGGQDEHARQQHLDPLRGLDVIAALQQLGGGGGVAGLGRRQHITGATVEVGMVGLHVEEGFGVAEFLAAHVVDPFAERALVVARNHLDLELLGAGTVDVGLQADLPFHVGVDCRLEIEAGDFRPFFVRSRLCGGQRRGGFVFPLHDALEPVQHAHVVFLPIIF